MSFPPQESLASMVSAVTETMFGMSFDLHSPDSESIPWARPWCTAVLPILGARLVNVVIASDQVGGALLGSAMFACKPGDVDDSMIDDSMRELVNIVAGQVKSAMRLDQSLGLPLILRNEEISAGPTGWRTATLRSGAKEIVVWVAVTDSRLDAKKEN